MRILHFEWSAASRPRYMAVGLLLALGCSGTDLSAESKAGRNLGLAGGQGNGGVGNSTGSNVSTGSTASAGSFAGGAGAAGGGTAISNTGGSSNSGPPTWSDLYTRYFGPNTAGDCASCHNTGTAPAFSSALTLCATLKSTGYIQNGSATLQNLLTWFGGSGTMPLVSGANPGNAVQDITAWQNAGAICP